MASAAPDVNTVDAAPASPEVSIITVTYNCASVVADALSSVSAQTYPAIEHLIIDGASTDSTLEVVRRVGTRVAQVLSEPDCGIYDAMNKGLARARGEWIGFLNADDLLATTDVIARMMQLVADEPATDVVYGDLLYVAADDLHRVVRYWQSGCFAPSRLRFGWMPPHPTFYVRRSVVAQVGLFAEDMRIAADYDFMLRCLARPGLAVRYLPEVLVHMRTGGASNRSLGALFRKSSEDLRALRRSGIGGFGTLACKNLRKLPQWLANTPPLRADIQPPKTENS